MILSVKVTVPASVKSQEALPISPLVETFLITSLYFTLGFTVIPPLSIVEPVNNAAEIYFLANSPA